MYHRRIPICEGNPFRRDKSIFVDKHRKLQNQTHITGPDLKFSSNKPLKSFKKGVN
jgi:hypothetical protein